MRLACRSALLMALALAFESVMAAVPCPSEPVRIVFSDRPAGRFLRGQGDAFQSPEAGIIVDEVRAVVAALGCPSQLLRAPQLRQVRLLDRGEVDIGIGFQDTPDRVRDWRFPMRTDGRVDATQALGSTEAVWIVLRERQASLLEDWRAGELGRWRLGAMRGTVTELMVASVGLRVEQVVAPNEVEKLLRLKRFDAIALPQLMIADELAARADLLATLAPPLGQMQYYAPASRRFYAESPEYVQAFWRGLCEQARRRSVLPGCLH